jgi:hypothetical protein
MAVSNAQITVTTSPTVIFGPDVDGAWVHIFALNAMYLGNADVTTGNGHYREANSNIDLFVGPNEVIYGIVAASTGMASYLATLNQ